MTYSPGSTLILFSCQCLGLSSILFPSVIEYYQIKSAQNLVMQESKEISIICKVHFNKHYLCELWLVSFESFDIF